MERKIWITWLILATLISSTSCTEGNTEPNDQSSESRFIQISNEIRKDVTLTSENEYLLTGQTFVKPGVTMTILPGTTIRSVRVDQVGAAPVLVVEPGARLIAEGTATQPITFTAEIDESKLPARGLWGGLIILGNAPVNQQGGQGTVEGLPGITFGGNDTMDNSGVLRYVRIWYGGKAIGQGNEINGLTLAGVGAGTTIEHCEVAWNLDDGFEFFGGTVNVKYLSALFCGDDSFDMDWGYQGKAQFLFSLSGSDVCGRGFEIDNDGGHMDAQPRTSPIVTNVTLIGPNTQVPGGDGTDQMIRLREGAGGTYRNIIALNGDGVGLRISDQATKDLVTLDEPQSNHTNLLYFSENNVIFNCREGSFHKDNPPNISAVEQDPHLRKLILGPAGYTNIDPRLQPESPFLLMSERIIGDPFLEDVAYVGAFDEANNWLAGWSWLALRGDFDD